MYSAKYCPRLAFIFSKSPGADVVYWEPQKSHFFLHSHAELLAAAQVQ